VSTVGHTQLQARIDWSPPAPPPVPAAADPHCPAPARRRARSFNRSLLRSLLAGPITTDEFEAGRPFGKRYSARLHDIRRWLWVDLAFPAEVDPIPPRCLDPEGAAARFEWALTPAARELAADALRAEAGR
jgi:hypothetical protein